MMKFKTGFLTLGLAWIALAWANNPCFAQETAIADVEQTKATETREDNATAEKDEAESKPKQKRNGKTRLAHIEITGALPESPGQQTLFGDLGGDVRKTVARLDKAAKDRRIAGVVLKIGSNSISRGKLNELRQAISRIQEEGKRVYAEMESATGPQFLLAAACDEIVMPEAGVVLIPGVHAEVAYYKDLLGKLGVEADMLHVGESKGAAEPYTRTNMSDGVRKNLTAMVDDLYDQLVTTVATDRDLEVESVRELVNQGLLTVTQAHEAGLVDRVLYPDQLREHLADHYFTDELVYIKNYAKKSVDTDFSGPMGMIKLFQTIMGADTRGGSSRGPKIAVVYAVGPIMSGKSANSAFGGQTMGSDTIIKALKEANDDDKVKAIVLRINSPGGSALASDMMWRATQQIDKPIVASMGDVAASGGYYIAMGADRILAEPGTITGSIGVVGGKVAMRGLYDKIGVTTDKITRGQNSGMFTVTNKFSESERQVITNMMHDIYRLFTTKAAAGRKMPLEKLEGLAKGQVYTGRDAKKNGLIDDTGTLLDAIRVAKELAGLDPDAKTGLKILPEPKNPLETLFGADLEEEKEVKLMTAASRLFPELASPLRHACQLRQVLREPVAVMMPFWLEIK